MTQSPSDTKCDVTKLSDIERKFVDILSECRASTSRGLSHSSGDYDGGRCSSRCSCLRQAYDNRPCLIVDSATRLHKTKWQSFKNLFRIRGKCLKGCNKKDKKDKDKSGVGMKDEEPPASGLVEKNEVIVKSFSKV